MQQGYPAVIDMSSVDGSHWLLVRLAAVEIKSCCEGTQLAPANMPDI